MENMELKVGILSNRLKEDILARTEAIKLGLETNILATTNMISMFERARFYSSALVYLDEVQSKLENGDEIEDIQQWLLSLGVDGSYFVYSLIESLLQGASVDDIEF